MLNAAGIHSQRKYIMNTGLKRVAHPYLGITVPDKNLAARPAVELRYNQALQKSLKKTIWQTGGCTVGT